MKGSLANAISVANNVSIESGGNLTNNGTLAKDVEIKSASETSPAGILKSTLGKIGGDVTNNGIFELSGDLTKSISGNGETVLKSSSVSATSGVNVTGTLNVNGNTLDLTQDATANTTLTLGAIKSGTTSYLGIDIDMSGNSTDTGACDQGIQISYR